MEDHIVARSVDGAKRREMFFRIERRVRLERITRPSRSSGISSSRVDDLGCWRRAYG